MVVIRPILWSTSNPWIMRTWKVVGSDVRSICGHWLQWSCSERKINKVTLCPSSQDWWSWSSCQCFTRNEYAPGLMLVARKKICCQLLYDARLLHVHCLHKPDHSYPYWCWKNCEFPKPFKLHCLLKFEKLNMFAYMFSRIVFFDNASLHSIETHPC